jgi:hypothetical protein
MWYDKKFKVKVSLYTKDKYIVQYTYHRFIPKWKALYFWFGLYHGAGLECWSIDLWDIDEAEKMAESLKSMKDVNEYFNRQMWIKKKWEAEEANWWEGRTPYKEKIKK